MSENETVKTFNVGGVEYQALKTGYGQAEQLSGVAQWLSRHGKGIFSGLSPEEEAENPTSEIELIMKALGKVTPKALVDLFDVVVGCGPAKAKEHFDIEILIDGTLAFFEQPAIKRVIERFFTSNDSSDQTDES